MRRQRREKILWMLSVNSLFSFYPELGIPNDLQKCLTYTEKNHLFGENILKRGKTAVNMLRKAGAQALEEFLESSRFW